MRLTHLLLWLAVMLAGGMPWASAQTAPGWGLPQLMRTLGQVRSASAHFTERKTVRMLDAPLVTSGTLTYVAPNYVRKATLSPVPEDFVLDRGQITMTGGPGNQTHHFSLAADPRIGGLVEGIRATLAGDLPTLDRFYSLRLSGTAASWQLLQQPKDAALASFIGWILIRGSENHIDAIETAGRDGSLSDMSITDDTIDVR